MIRRSHTRVFLPAFAVLLLTGVAYSLLYTTPGARFLLERAGAWLPGGLAVENISGNLHSGLSLGGLSFDVGATSITTGKLDIQVAFDLFPPAVSVKSLVVDRLLIRSRGEEARRNLAADILAGLALPLPVNFKRLEVDHLAIQDLSADSVFTATALRFSGLWYDRLVAEEATLEADDTVLNAAGELTFASPFPINATLNATINNGLPAAADGSSPATAIQLEARLNGTLEDLALQVVLEQPALIVEGHARSLLTTPIWDLHLQNDALQWPLASATADTPPRVALHQVAAQITGTLHQYALKVQGVLDLQDGLEESPGDGRNGRLLGDLSLQAAGDLNGLQLEQLSLSGDWVSLTATGPVAWADGFRVELVSQIKMLNPGRWIPQWPTDHPAHGTLDVSWQDGRLAVSALDLQARDSKFRVTGSGLFDPEQDMVRADLAWQSLQWPLVATQPAFRSDSGLLKVSGKPDDWTLAGRLQLQAGDWPKGLLAVNGRGDLESAQLQIEQGEVLGGQFEGQFNYRWTDNQPWSANIQTKNLDLTALAGNYPAVVSARLVASGQMEPKTLDLDIRNLTGRIHGQPLQASGQIAFAAGLLRARELQIRSGPSNIVLNGNVRDKDGIHFAGHIDSLASFIDQANGSITGAGRVSLDPVSPVLELDVQGNDLAWADWHLASFSAGPLDSETEGYADPFALRMDLTGLSVGDRIIDEISLTSHGQLPLEQTRISARRGETRLEAFISGSLQNWQALDTVNWSGNIDSMRLNNDEIGYLELEQPARFALGYSAASLEPACFRGSKNGLWCADVSWVGMNQQDRGHLVANASLEQVTLNLARFLLGTDLAFTQTLNGTLHWEKLPGSAPVANVQIRVSEGQVTSADESATMQTGPGLFGFIIENGKLLAGNMDISIPEAGFIDIDFSAPDISRGRNSPLEGRVQIDLSSIEPFMPWVRALDHAEGVINADIRLGGTVADPRLTGHASLARGRIEHFTTGLVLSDIKLAGAVFEDNHTELNGNFMAGAGAGRISAAVNFDRILKPEITLKITGQDLTLVNVPDMIIKIDPDLLLQWHDSALQLDGRIRVPLAKISPRYLPTVATGESSDVVIVAGQLPAVEQSVFDRSRLRLTGSVAVELGKDVTLTLERATARFQGTTVFNWNGDLLPIADGKYSVTGKITAYGQVLQVADGWINFPRVPANNPRLDIRAEREIYGNVRVKQAGVRISGTLKRPLLEAYTRPDTTQERALALLLTGSDFDYDQGIGAVEVGLYIAPKLYVSYGIDLFESDSVISARYDLGRGFGIKVTSGQRQTGGDITYTIDR